MCNYFPKLQKRTWKIYFHRFEQFLGSYVILIKFVLAILPKSRRTVGFIWVDVLGFILRMQCKCMQKCGKWISQKKWRNWFLYFSTYYFIFLLCRIAWTKKPWSYALCTDLKSTLLKRYLPLEKSISMNFSVVFFYDLFAFKNLKQKCKWIKQTRARNGSIKLLIL